MSVSDFLDHHYRHFNARETLAAARGFKRHVEDGGKMLLALAGAMSTAELGVSLARMVRAGKIHAISSTAANLEEDVFNLIAHREYRAVPDYRDLTPEAERALRDEGFNRVTDTCIPETCMRHLEEMLIADWSAAARNGESFFPHEFLYRVIERGDLEPHYQLPKEDSWVVAACEQKLPIYTPGWEDSTLGNIFAARVMQGVVPSHTAIKHGTAQMEHLVGWYLEQQQSSSVGFFQIGGGIAGDFAICAVPLIIQDLKQPCKFWSYFAQISDAQASYGSYSGAVPNEKITWYKLDPETPRYMIQSDASIVAPLIFAYVLGE